MQVTITGSGTPIPTPDRAGPGVLVEAGGLRLQFDAGRSTVMRLMGADAPPGVLDAVFVTHHHSDHLSGLADIVMTRWILDRAETLVPLPIIAPKGPASRFVERMLDPWVDDLAVRREHMQRNAMPAIELVEFDAPEQLSEVWASGQVRVSSIQVRHEPVTPAVGFRIDSPEGSVAITGDTLVCDEVGMLADGVDILVYEALRFSAIRKLGPDRQLILDYHADTVEIGRQTAALDIPTLLLTHLIPPPADADAANAFVDDVRSGGYTGEVIVADDLTTVTLPRGT